MIFKEKSDDAHCITALFMLSMCNMRLLYPLINRTIRRKDMRRFASGIASHADIMQELAIRH